ncbi:MAG: hypothetical protein ACP5H8_02350 [Candidatus Micrarchaeia archaeon]
MTLNPFDLKVEFSPLRLRKGDEKPMHMKIYLKNLEPEEVLTSVIVEIPKEAGFDRTGIVNRKEIRIGKIAPKEERSIDVDLYSHQKTEQGVFPIKIIANKHYRGYSHVFSNTVKEVTLRIV